MATQIDIRKMIADYLDETARWRQEKAEEYPDDARNGRCASVLREMAAEVRAMERSDPSLAVLESMHERWDLDVFSPGEDGARLVGRWGFDAPGGTASELVEALAVAAVGDSNDPEEEE
jgi:hypothetical protein